MLCRPCREALADEAFAARPRWCTPTPRPPGCPPVCAALALGPVGRALLSAHKDEGRAELTGVLAGPLAEALAVAVASVPTATAPPLVVVAPSSRAARRRRGEDPVHRIAAQAADDVRAAGGRVEGPRRGVLVHRRRVADQSGLDSTARARNLRGALGVPARLAGLVAGRSVVVVDDVVTTGATLAEAARALHAAGAVEVVAATVCATQRRPTSSPDGPSSPPSHPRAAIG